MTTIEKHDPNQDLNEKINWSKAMSTGSLLPRQYQNNPANLMFAAEYADALGISRIHVLTSIAVINGRPSPSADLMSAMVRNKGHKLRVTGDDTYAEATLIRVDDPDYEFTARWDERKARTAGLWGNKGPWTQYPAAMLRARAISEVVRMGASDVMAGAIYTPEESGALVDESGHLIEQPQQPRRQGAQRPQQRDTAKNRLAQQLGTADTPTQQQPVPQHDTPDVWAERIAESTTEDDLMGLYTDASHHPEWGEVIKPMFSTRKQQIQQEDTTPGPQHIDGELVDPTPEEARIE